MLLRAGEGGGGGRGMDVNGEIACEARLHFIRLSCLCPGRVVEDWVGLWVEANDCRGGRLPLLVQGARGRALLLGGMMFRSARIITAVAAAFEIQGGKARS